jgi:hypothetical protein
MRSADGLASFAGAVAPAGKVSINEQAAAGLPAFNMPRRETPRLSILPSIAFCVTFLRFPSQINAQRPCKSQGTQGIRPSFLKSMS